MKTRLRDVHRRILSAPIYVKVLGVGTAMAALFGGLLLLGLRPELAASFQRAHARESRALAVALGSRVQQPLLTRDLYEIRRALQEIRRAQPDLRYAIVADAEGHVVGHVASTNDLPAALVRPLRHPERLAPDGEEHRWETEGGTMVFDTALPVLEGSVGSVRLGLGNDRLRDEMVAATRYVLLALGLVTALGLAVAMILSYLVTRPIHHLVIGARRASRGHFDHTTPVFYNDEIGTLAETFNDMLDSLRRYRADLKTNEAAREELLERLITSQEQEQARLARELHDGLGQSLSATLMAVRTTDGPCRDGQDIEERILGLIDETRRMATGLHPPVLDDYGLASALERHVSTTTRLTGLPVEFQEVRAPGAPDRLGAITELVLYRVAQEALNNVVRHADATRASVVLYHRRDGAMLLVEDDGKGFDAGPEQTAGGLGLSSMRERVALAGGELFVEAAEGKGTIVRAVIPATEEGDRQDAAHPDR